ncbi:MAG: VPLPA-CTERM sorting domain-containing protein [Pseudomonadota bacterium]
MVTRSFAAAAVALVLTALPAEAVTRIFTFEGVTTGSSRITNAPSGIGYTGQVVIDGSVVGEQTPVSGGIDILYRDALLSIVLDLANGERVETTGPSDIFLEAFFDVGTIVDEFQFEALDIPFTVTSGLEQFSQVDDASPPKLVTFDVDRLTFGTTGEDGFQDLDTLATVPLTISTFLGYDADQPFVTAISGGGTSTGTGAGVGFSSFTSINETSVIPLPAGGVLLLSGLLAFGVLRRRAG